MGKKSSGYSEKRRAELFEAYKKAYPELSIYAVQDREKQIAKQAKEIQDLKQTMDSLMNMLALVAQGKGQLVVGEVNGQKIPAFKLKDEDAVTALQPIGMTPRNTSSNKKKTERNRKAENEGVNPLPFSSESAKL